VPLVSLNFLWFSTDFHGFVTFRSWKSHLWAQHLALTLAQHCESKSMLLISYALIAFTLSPLSMVPQHVRSVVRMEDAPAVVVKESTPESKAAAKAAYEANKAKREAKKAQRVGTPGATGASKKRKNSKFDKLNRARGK